MRTNFVPSFFHSRKELDTSARACVPSSLRTDSTCLPHPDNKNSTPPQDEPAPHPKIQPTKPSFLPEEDTASQDQSSSCKESESGVKTQKLLTFFTKERSTSPLHKERSPTPPPLPSSPNFKESRIHSNHFMPIRATLKNLVQNKAAPEANRSYRKE